MDIAGIEKWVQAWTESEKDNYHVLEERSPVLLTTAYAEDVVNGYQMAGKWVKRACERHLRDLKRSKEDPNYLWRFDEKKAYRPIKFIETKTVASKNSNKHLVMQPWQHFFIGCLFGWVHKDTGLRRFREALIFLGRKNGRVLPL